MKILLADDNPKPIVSILRKLGAEVVVAKQSEDVITLLEQEAPDIIVFNYTMKDTDSRVCVKKIRKMLNYDVIPIIYLAADTVTDVTIKKMIDAGFDDFLIHPISETKLAVKIKTMQRIYDMRKKILTTTQQLSTISSIDNLTGLYNRNQFEKTLKEKLSEADRYKNIVTLMFVDLDFFKNINDTLGYHTGNLVLQQLASRIKSNFRLEDFIARLGGDEFVIILNHIENMYTVENIANKIIKIIREPIEIDNKKIRMTCSIGIAFYPDEGITKDMFMQNADIAMYDAKRKGRNNYQYFSQSLNQNYRKNIVIGEELKYAMEKKEIQLRYYPIINLETKYLYGMEAVMVWQNEKFGTVHAGEFMSLAEKNGMITEMGVWMLNNVLQQAANWVKQGHRDFIVSFNLPLHFFDGDKIVQIVSYYIDRYNIPGKVLQLEINDIAILNDKKFNNMLIKLKQLDVNFALSAFGASSLVVLKRLPIDAVKLDPSFLENINENNKNITILNSLIHLAKDLHLNIIAEGINTEEQYKLLSAHGCQFGEGPFISDLVNEVEMSDYLNKEIIART